MWRGRCLTYLLDFKQKHKVLAKIWKFWLCPDMGSACLLGPLYHSWKCWVSSDVDAHFLSSRMQGLFFGVVAKLCRRPGTLDIECELSIRGEQLTMGGVNLHALWWDYTFLACPYRGGVVWPICIRNVLWKWPYARNPGYRAWALDNSTMKVTLIRLRQEPWISSVIPR